MKKKPSLIFEIILVICLKLAVIFGIWYFFFSPSHRPSVTPDTVGNVLLGAPTETTPKTPN